MFYLFGIDFIYAKYQKNRYIMNSKNKNEQQELYPGHNRDKKELEEYINSYDYKSALKCQSKGIINSEIWVDDETEEGQMVPKTYEPGTKEHEDYLRREIFPHKNFVINYKIIREKLTKIYEDKKLSKKESEELCKPLWKEFFDLLSEHEECHTDLDYWDSKDKKSVKIIKVLDPHTQEAEDEKKKLHNLFQEQWEKFKWHFKDFSTKKDETKEKLIDNNHELISRKPIKKEKYFQMRVNFRKTAQNRVDSILQSINSLGNCSNKYYYAFNSNEVKQMRNAILQEVDIVFSKFKYQHGGSIIDNNEKQSELLIEERVNKLEITLKEILKEIKNK